MCIQRLWYVPSAHPRVSLVFPRCSAVPTLRSNFPRYRLQFKKPFAFRKKKGADHGDPPELPGQEPSTKDPLGLKVIHRPPGERTVDLIFVHGLGGSSQSTWSHNRNPDFFWPLKFLPLEPEISKARILTFGYNANFGPGGGKSKMTFLDFAKDLLYDLKYAQDESVPELEDLGMGNVRVSVHSGWSRRLIH